MSQALSSSVASSSSSKDDHGKIYPSSASDYDVLEEVGQGAFATVYRAIVKLTGEEVAIKVLNLDDFDLNWEEVRREILTMYNLAHSNVVKIYVSFVDGQDLWIVMPLCEAGSCATIMKTLAPNGFKNEVLLATIIKKALKGLEYLHKHDHIHRDIKAGNILVGKNGEIKLADFGVATTLLENGDRKKNRQTFTGTPCWMAPEVMEHSTGYGAKADIWSLGITAMELGYGRAPYSSLHPMKVMLAVLQEDPPTCAIYRDNSHQFSKYYHEFIAKCLRKDPTKRPTATKLLDHKFLRQAKDQQYIYEQMVSKLPPRPAAAPAQLRPHTCASKTLLDAEKEKKSKPVSVGSWVFDKEAFDQFKSKFQDEVKAEALAHKELAQTYCHPDGQESEDDDHPAIANANGNGVPKESPSAASRRNVFSDRSLFDEPTPSLHNSSVGASSPNGAAAEHKQGRFMVSEMEDSQVSGNHESGTDGDGGGLPVFHSGTLSISQSSYAPPIIGSQPNYATTPVHDQVGRFEVTEDEDA